MAYSLMRVVSDGTLATIALTFPFFDKSHIVVSVGPTELPGGGYTFVWLNSTTIKITPAVSNGVEVVVRRRTPYGEVFNIFDAGAVFNEYFMDENFRQLLFSFQEALESNKSTDVYNDLNLHGYRVSNVANALNGRDAVPYSQYQADTQGAYQQRLACEQYTITCQQQAGIATTAAQLAASGAVAASNTLIVSTANATAKATAKATALSALAPIDVRVTALEARKYTTLVPTTYPGGAPHATHETSTTQLPASVTANTRYILTNPFGINTRVAVVLELYVNGRWAEPKMDGNSGGGAAAYGAYATYVQGEGIVVQTGSAAVIIVSNQTGGGHGYTGTTMTSAPCRVFVHKLED